MLPKIPECAIDSTRHTRELDTLQPLCHSMVPRPISGIDLRTLPIGPQEAFVLSRVDGQATIREIGYATSIAEDQVVEHLRRLKSLGAVEFAESAQSIAPRPAARRTPSANVGAVHTTRSPVPESPSIPPRTEPRVALPATMIEPKISNVADDAKPYDRKELDDTADIDVVRKQEILDLYYRLEVLDHYRLLGVPPDADRRQIKAAYYEKVKVFHPDRYFGKDLGSFRAKLERCFARLTVAHDTLAASSSREEYDAYLSSQRQTVELERALSQTVTLDDFDLLEQQLNASLQATASMAPAAATPPCGTRSDAEPDGMPNAEVSNSQPPGSIAKMSDEDRKRYFARKLRVSSASLRAVSRPPSVPPQPSTPPPSREQIADQLRRQLGGSRRQLETHLAAADSALAANDPVSAANSLRLAQSLAPNDPHIAERLARAQSLAAQALSDTYLHQAEYEEKSGRFEFAARSYDRAAQGKPSAEVWEAAARCAFNAGVDMRAAAEYARRSVAMNSERPTSHLLLGQIFLAAQMRSSAIAELERARRLDPNNDTVLNLLKRIATKEI